MVEYWMPDVGFVTPMFLTEMAELYEMCETGDVDSVRAALSMIPPGDLMGFKGGENDDTCLMAAIEVGQELCLRNGILPYKSAFRVLVHYPVRPCVQ
jgi:hypothetical protein